jgi:hypothetical protein
MTDYFFLYRLCLLDANENIDNQYQNPHDTKNKNRLNLHKER